MIEIPRGKSCKKCAYSRFDDDYWRWRCDYPMDWWSPDNYENEKSSLRCSECLSAYPKGADITIKAR